jgi:DNA-directed RNA polymerase specialized sigma24 family protein
LGFSQFAISTRKHWERMAEYLARRWRLPQWATGEDLVQDLLLGAWEAVWKYEPTRGATLAGHVTYSACDKAKKRLHRYRGANLHRRADHNPGRGELSLGRVFGEDADRRVEQILAQPPPQELEVERVQALARVMAACVTEQERRVMATLAEVGDLVRGVQQLQRAAGGDARETVRVVVGVVEAVARRLAEDDPEVGAALRQWGVAA